MRNKPDVKNLRPNLRVMESTPHRKIKTRNKERTKTKILKAVGEIIEQAGIERVTIANVSRKAGVNKILLYRYFGNIGGLVKQYYLGRLTGPVAVSDTTETAKVPAQSELKPLAQTLLDMLDDLNSDHAINSLFKLEFQTRQDFLPLALAEQVAQALGKAKRKAGNQDAGALAALLCGALYFLTAIASHPYSLVGMDLQQEDSWRRIRQLVKDIAACLS